MTELENLNDVERINVGIKKTLIGMMDEIDAMTKEDAIYLKASMRRAIEHPDEFRHSGYTFENMHYLNHKRNGRGKLITCDALFDSEWKLLLKAKNAVEMMSILGIEK